MKEETAKANERDALVRGNFSKQNYVIVLGTRRSAPMKATY